MTGAEGVPISTEICLKVFEKASNEEDRDGMGRAIAMGMCNEGTDKTKYTGGRTQAELDDLARDPDHNFQISDKTIAEREAALKVEAKGETESAGTVLVDS